MILYTVMPLELVMGETDPGIKMSVNTYLGKQVLTRASLDGSVEIVQLLSTDPQDYLNERLMPGARVLA